MKRICPGCDLIAPERFTGEEWLWCTSCHMSTVPATWTNRNPIKTLFGILFLGFSIIAFAIAFLKPAEAHAAVDLSGKNISTYFDFNATTTDRIRPGSTTLSAGTLSYFSPDIGNVPYAVTSGGSQYVQPSFAVNGVDSLITSHEFAWAGWVLKDPTPGSNIRVLQAIWNDGVTSSRLQIYDDTTFVVTVGTNYVTPCIGATTITTNTWYHVAVRNISGKVTLYVNGQVDAMCNASAGSVAIDLNGASRLFYERDNPTLNFDGSAAQWIFSSSSANFGTSTIQALYGAGDGADVCGIAGIQCESSSGSAQAIAIIAPAGGSYLNPFSTTVFATVSSSIAGTLKFYYQGATSTTIIDFPGLVGSGTYFDHHVFTNGLYAVWSTFKASGYATSTSNIRQFDVGGAGNFSSSSGIISESQRHDLCSGVGTATSSGFWNQAATDFSNGIARGLCESAVFLFVPGQISVPTLALDTRVPFDQIYALYDVSQNLIANPTSTQTFGIIIPTLPRPATTTVFAINTSQAQSGIFGPVLRAAEPYVIMLLYFVLILYSMGWVWLITILLD